MRFYLYMYRKPILITLVILLILGLATGLLASLIGQLQQDHMMRMIYQHIPGDYNNAELLSQPIRHYVVEEGKQPYPEDMYNIFFFDGNQCIGYMTCGYIAGSFHVQYLSTDAWNDYQNHTFLEEAVAAGQPVGFYYTKYGEILYSNGNVELDVEGGSSEAALELLRWPVFLGMGMYEIELLSRSDYAQAGG